MMARGKWESGLLAVMLAYARSQGRAGGCAICAGVFAGKRHRERHDRRYARFRGAVHWYSRSANQGFGPAQQNLAQLHMKGQGTAQNLVQAYKWFALAGRNAKEYQMSPSTKARFKKELSEEEWNAKVKRDEALMETEENMVAATSKLEGAMPPADLTRAKQLVETFVAKREK
jgi:hypothetical protein